MWRRHGSNSDVPADCLECRLIGTGSMLALSGYFVFLTQQLPKTATLFQRRFNVAMSFAFAAAGVARFFA